MSHQEQFYTEGDGPVTLSNYLLDSIGDELGLQRLEKVINNTSSTFLSKVQSLIEMWQLINQGSLQNYSEYCVRLMDWLKLHTLNIVLQEEWKLHNYDPYREELLQKVSDCDVYLTDANSMYSLRCDILVEIIKDPWKKPDFSAIVSDQITEATLEAMEFFRKETGQTLSTRIIKLCKYHCEDIALKLLTIFIKCHSRSKVENSSLHASLNQIRYCYDVYVALLFKFKHFNDIEGVIRKMTPEEGLELITRFSKGRQTTLKIWKHSKQILHILAVGYGKQILATPPENNFEVLEAFFEVWLSAINTTRPSEIQAFQDNIRNIIFDAESTIFLYSFCEIIYKKIGKQIKTFVIELYIRVLTTDMNIMEREKNENESEKTSTTSTRLADGFLQLAEVLDEHVKVSRECALTSFSIVPTKTSLNKIIALAVRLGCESVDSWKCKYHPPNMSGPALKRCNHCGEYISEVKKTPLNINTALSEALTTEDIGLDRQSCDDLVVLLSCNRYQFLNWLVSWTDLYRLCVMYLDDAEGTRNFVKDLMFLEIDNSLHSKVENKKPTFEPYVNNARREETASDVYAKPVKIESEATLLQPYCSANNSANNVVKSLRNYRKTGKRINTTILNNKPHEKVSMPSNAAPSTSSAYADTCLEYSDKITDFFSPFYYFVNDYNKRIKLAPDMKKPTSCPSTSTMLAPGKPSNLVLEKISTDCNPIDYSTTYSPIDFSKNSQILGNSEPREITAKRFKPDFSNNCSTSFALEFEKTVNSTGNFVEGGENSMIISEGYSEVSNNTNRFLDDFLEKRYDARDHLVDKNVVNPVDLIIKNDHQYIFSELKSSDKNSIIENDLGNDLNTGEMVLNEVSIGLFHKKHKFYKDSVLQDDESSHTAPNFHVEGQNTDSPENISNKEKSLKDSAMNTEDTSAVPIVYDNEDEQDGISKAIQFVDSDRSVNLFFKNVETLNRDINAKNDADSKSASSKNIGNFGQIIQSCELLSKPKKGTLSELKPNSEVDQAALPSDIINLPLKHICNRCSPKIKTLAEYINDAEIYKQILDISKECMDNQHKLNSETLNNNSIICSLTVNNDEDHLNVPGCSQDTNSLSSKLNTLRENENISNVDNIIPNLMHESASNDFQKTDVLNEINISRCQKLSNIDIESDSLSSLHCNEKGNNASDDADLVNLIDNNIPEPTNDHLDSTNNIIQSNVNQSKDEEITMGKKDFLTNDYFERFVMSTKICMSSIDENYDEYSFENEDNIFFECQPSVPPDQRNLRYVKKRYNLRNSHEVLNSFRGKTCCATVINKKNKPITKYKRYTKLHLKPETVKLLTMLKAGICKNTSSPLQDSNPKVISGTRNFSIPNFIKIHSNTLEPLISFCRLPIGNQNKPILTNVPGLNDLHHIKPSCVNKTVHVIQVPGSRTNPPISANMMQISPHIQRIGQPRFEKIDCSGVSNNSTNLDSITCTPSAAISLVSQQTTQTNNTKSVKNVPAINIFSQTIKSAPGFTSEIQLNCSEDDQNKTKKIRKSSKLSKKSVKRLKKQPGFSSDLQRKEVIVQKDLHLQKSLSEECADLGVDEPSTNELFPEADFINDSSNQLRETNDVPKEVGIFDDIQSVRPNYSFDKLVTFSFEGSANGTQDSNSIDSTLLDTSLSPAQVTIPDPCVENIGFPCKYEQSVYSDEFEVQIIAALNNNKNRKPKNTQIVTAGPSFASHITKSVIMGNDEPVFITKTAESTHMAIADQSDSSQSVECTNIGNIKLPNKNSHVTPELPFVFQADESTKILDDESCLMSRTAANGKIVTNKSDVNAQVVTVELPFAPYNVESTKILSDEPFLVSQTDASTKINTAALSDRSQVASDESSFTSQSAESTKLVSAYQ